MNDDMKLIAWFLLFCLVCGAGASVADYFKWQQKIEFEKVRCSK